MYASIKKVIHADFAATGVNLRLIQLYFRIAVFAALTRVYEMKKDSYWFVIE